MAKQEEPVIVIAALAARIKAKNEVFLKAQSELEEIVTIAREVAGVDEGSNLVMLNSGEVAFVKVGEVDDGAID